MLHEEDNSHKYARIVEPHLNAAYNLARWLMGDSHDAEDVVQEACLRAFRFMDGFRGGDGRAWFLTIVRNTGYTWLQRNRAAHLNTTSFDDEIHAPHADAAQAEAMIHQRIDEQMLRRALEELPVEFREVIVLRELEGFSYKEIADVANIPIGTVMSRLARARTRLQEHFAAMTKKEEN